MKQEVSNKMKPAEECTSLKKASDKLKANAGDAEVIDVPEGDPLFLFSYAVGRTRPINVFYDSGCSHVVFKNGVPGKNGEGELDGELTQKGPLKLKNVGAVEITVQDEWA